MYVLYRPQRGKCVHRHLFLVAKSYLYIDKPYVLNIYIRVYIDNLASIHTYTIFWCVYYVLGARVRVDIYACMLACVCAYMSVSVCVCVQKFRHMTIDIHIRIFWGPDEKSFVYRVCQSHSIEIAYSEHLLHAVASLFLFLSVCMCACAFCLCTLK